MEAATTTLMAGIPFLDCESRSVDQRQQPGDKVPYRRKGVGQSSCVHPTVIEIDVALLSGFDGVPQPPVVVLDSQLFGGRDHVPVMVVRPTPILCYGDDCMSSRAPQHFGRFQTFVGGDGIAGFSQRVKSRLSVLGDPHRFRHG